MCDVNNFDRNVLYLYCLFCSTVIPVKPAGMLNHVLFQSTVKVGIRILKVSLDSKVNMRYDKILIPFKSLLTSGMSNSEKYLNFLLSCSFKMATFNSP